MDDVPIGTMSPRLERLREAAGDALPRPRNVVPFASKSPSNYAWTPLQLLEQLLEDVKAGTVKPSAILTVLVVENDQGGFALESWRSQMDWTEEFTYLEIARQQVLRNRTREG